MAPVRGGAASVHGRDPDDRRVTDNRRGEVPQRIVVRALPLHATEALGGEAALEAVGAGAPRAAELLVLVEIERDRASAR